MPSYSPVFSAQFIVYTDGNPISTYEVPAGFTAVIRDMSAIAQFAYTEYQLAIADSIDAPNCVVAQLTPTGILNYQQWKGRVVVPAGGIMTLFMGELEIGSSVYVGGYLLRNTLT